MFEELYGKIKEIVTAISHVLELIAGLFVLIAVIITMVSLIPEIPQLAYNHGSTQHFLEFIEQVFLVVIGVEFLKMLCRPNSDNVLETIIFLVARHMIVVTTTTPLDDFISTISIILLCLVRRYLKERRLKDKMSEKDWKKLEEGQV